MAFNWKFFVCVRWSKRIDYKTGGIWVHACFYRVSRCLAHQILFLSQPVNGIKASRIVADHDAARNAFGMVDNDNSVSQAQ